MGGRNSGDAIWNEARFLNGIRKAMHQAATDFMVIKTRIQSRQAQWIPPDGSIGNLHFREKLVR